MSFFRRFCGGYDSFRKDRITQFDITDLTSLRAQEKPDVHELHLRPPFTIYDSGKKIEAILRRNGVPELQEPNPDDPAHQRRYCDALGLTVDSYTTLLYAIMQTHQLYVLWMTSTPHWDQLNALHPSSPTPRSSPSPLEKPRRSARVVKRAAVQGQQS